MSEPVYEVKFPEEEGGNPRLEKVNAEKPSVSPREAMAVLLLIVGTVFLSVGVGGLAGSLWAGIAVFGFVLTIIGLLLGNNS